MAANNYFGFSTGGAQYSSTPGQTNYPTGNTGAGYTVQQTAQAYPTNAATAVAQQRASQPPYETYQAAALSTTSYPYATRQQPPFDKTQQTYYQTQISYSTTETGPYQNVSNNKPVYSTMNYPARQIPATQKAQPQSSQTGSSYLYSSNASSSSTSSNYAATYNNSTPTAATSTHSASAYVQQPTVVTQPPVPQSHQVHTIQSSITSSVSTPKVYANSWMSFKKGPVRLTRSKLPPKPQQLHYCEICKISCAGPQTYKEHLEGQKHKKKAAASKAGIAAPLSRGGSILRCELCDVTCTGSDAYAAHIRGSKHQKVVKLHTKLGKPIPSTEPQVVSIGTTNSKETDGSKVMEKSVAGATVKQALPSKVNFVSAGTMKLEVNEIKELLEENFSGDKVEENEVQPVGQDYIEEIKNDDGKVLSFQCKLCECRFNDPNAKEMHMKGRRHRLQYKRKVNPDLVVDIKPSLRQRKIQEDRFRRQQIMDELWKRREEERWREEMRMVEEEGRLYWEERRRYEGVEFYEWHRRFGRKSYISPLMPPHPRSRPYIASMPPTGLGNPFLKRPTTVDDRHVIAKHTQIYPKEEELNAVQKIITNSEKALKQVSDFLTDYDKKDVPKGPTTTVTTSTEEVKEDSSETEIVSEANQQYRVLKGVMRVGVLAKGLVLTGDLKVQLVVMCAEKPTRTLLERVIDNLPKQLKVVAPEEKYEVKRCIEEAAIIVSSVVEPKISVTVTLTSPVMRNANITEGSVITESIKDPSDMLDRQKCLEALAALRHAKWFQAKAAGLESCVMIIRILRDLCQRVPTWSHLNDWTMELLVEKVLSSTGQPLSPGDALRRVFEAIASGILLPASSGLLDPCEKEPFDATSLSNQEREDITASAQHALRLIAFRQIHKVLSMEPLPPPKFTRGLFTRKRRRDNVTEGIDAEGSQNGKKDKKDDLKTETTEAVEANEI